MQYQGFKGLSKEEYAESLLGAANLESGQQFAIVDKASDLLIGDVYLQKAGSEYWLGYTIHPDFGRQGLAKEVTLGVLAWLKAHGATKVKAGVLPENQASIGLLKALGFTYRRGSRRMALCPQAQLARSLGHFSSLLVHWTSSFA